jgi:hypothetical protein
LKKRADVRKNDHANDSRARGFETPHVNKKELDQHRNQKSARAKRGKRRALVTQNQTKSNKETQGNYKELGRGERATVKRLRVTLKHGGDIVTTSSKKTEVIWAYVDKPERKSISRQERSN